MSQGTYVLAPKTSFQTSFVSDFMALHSTCNIQYLVPIGLHSYTDGCGGRTSTTTKKYKSMYMHPSFSLLAIQ